jgi:hypothetical protein
MSQVTGIIKIYIDGKMLRTKPGAKLKMGGKKREAQSGHSVYGYTEEVVPSELDATIVHMSDTDVVEMSNWVDVTLKVETDTGQTYLVKDAFTAEPCELASGGEVPLKMIGQPAVKQ